MTFSKNFGARVVSDYVFRPLADGGLDFIGDFDGLYVNTPDPWQQSGADGPRASYYEFSRNRLALALAEHLPGQGFRLEVGCGHGHSMRALEELAGGCWHGLDISRAAISQAKALYPQFGFYAGDIASRDCFTPHYVGKYDAVVLSQLLWYVLKDLDAVICNALRFVRPGGLLVVSQAFLREPQLYGGETVNGFKGALLAFLRQPGIELIEARYDDTGTHAHHDGLLIFRKVAV
jgi:SAM-dependent methyltransferase